MIQFDTVSKRYATGAEAIRSLSFAVEAGEFIFLTGHSGAGKSTLLKLIALLEKPSRGQIVVGGQNLKTIDRARLPYYRRQVGMVFQEHRLLPDLSIYDNVALPLRIAGASDSDIARSARVALDKVGLLKREKAKPLELSGGEQQRVGIARAIVNRPPVLLADEPTGNLDPKLAQEVMQTFVDLQQLGAAVVVASHDLPLVKRWRKRVLILAEGQLIDDYRPEAASAEA